jgi:osmoprotectant transport system permease protein
MIRTLFTVAVLFALLLVPLTRSETGLRIGSKKFTESVILGEMLAALCRSAREPAVHLREMGGTRYVYDALVARQIDIYPEYTGTIREEIFAGADLLSLDAMRRALAERGLVMSEPLGFNNTYALAVRPETAERLQLKTISDLTRHPELTLGFGNEFMDRGDGWPALKRHYGLPQRSVHGMDHDLAYAQLDVGAIDVMDVYSTDAKIERYDLVLLEDDKTFFPRYEAVLLYRAALEEDHPQALTAMLQLAGTLHDQAMTRLNAQVEIDRQSESATAAGFLGTSLSIAVAVDEETVAARIWRHTLEHIDLVRKSLIPAILAAIPLGILAAKRPRIGQAILGGVGIIQTIPSLALLVLLMAPVAWFGLSSVGTGSATAITALFLYSLLPIVRNTYTGLTSIPDEYRESAEALGVSAWFRLRRIELPLASPTILAGIKTAAVINVGFATLGALISAGGYGQPIITGIRLNSTSLIMQGAIPAAVLALLTQWLFDLAERWVVPKGLRQGNT